MVKGSLTKIEVEGAEVPVEISTEMPESESVSRALGSTFRFARLGAGTFVTAFGVLD